MLRAGLRGKRLRLSDDERRRLAVKAQALGREALAHIASVATPRYASALVVPSIYSSASPWVGSQPCGAKYPGFCADSKGV